MYTIDELRNHLEQISECAHFTRFKYWSTESYIVQLRCRLEPDQFTEYYKEQLSQWIRKFSTFTATTWIVLSRNTKVTKTMLYRKTYACHRAALNKQKPCFCSLTDTALNQDCKAQIDFRVMVMNTKKLLKERRNLKITIQFTHSHPLRTARAFNMLKSNSDTDEIFYRYFNRGFSALAAKTYHTLWLTIKYGNNSEHLMNATINPTFRHVSYLYSKIKQKLKEGKSSEELMSYKKTSLEIAGGFIHYKHDDPRAITIITPIMKRVVSTLKTTHVLVDSTAMNGDLVVTFLYVPSKVGALPVACILHQGRSAATYSQIFHAVKQYLETISGHNFEPHLLTTKVDIAMRQAAISTFPKCEVIYSRWSICTSTWSLFNGQCARIDGKFRLMEAVNKMVRSDNIELCRKHYADVLSPYLSLGLKRQFSEHIDDMWRECEITHKYSPDNTCMNLVEASIRIMDEFIQNKCMIFDMYEMVDVVCNIVERQTRRVVLSHTRSLNVAATYTTLIINHTIIEDYLKSFKTGKPAAKERYAKFRYDTLCCDCAAGKLGRFCQHLCITINIHEYYFMKTVELTDSEKLTFTAIVQESPITIEPEPMDAASSQLHFSANENNRESEDMIKTDNDDVKEEENSVDMQTEDIGDARLGKNPTGVESVEETYDVESGVETNDVEINEDSLGQNPTAIESVVESNDVESNEDSLGQNPTGAEGIVETDDGESDEHSLGQNPTVVQSNENLVEGQQSSTTTEPGSSKQHSEEDLLTKYVTAMKNLNDEFRRLNKLFRDNPNDNNLNTMQRLAGELGKICPMEKYNLGGITVTYNKKRRIDLE